MIRITRFNEFKCKRTWYFDENLAKYHRKNSDSHPYLHPISKTSQSRISTMPTLE